MNASVRTAKVCNLWCCKIFSFFCLQCAFTHRLIKAKACRLLLPDSHHVLGTGGRWLGGATFTYLCRAWALWPSKPPLPAHLSGWQQGVVQRGAASGALSRRKGEAGPLAGAGESHLVTASSWPESGWKLLGSSAACSWLNPSGWLYWAVIPEASGSRMPLKPGIFCQRQHFYERHQALMSLYEVVRSLLNIRF